ncbi:uncharacterized protein [Rutidosis leptorrhynchoides]|uniref:uncharacterized protein n=1 Tax=Rutidosis leptorrhynchoides TaxID=125765 RepID=UPI003A99195C
MHVQMHVYFVSNALSGSEVNYPPIEKLVYALVHTARRLRIYFQAHPIVPEVFGRLDKWAIELGEPEINYSLRTTIKGQILADYLAEMITEIEAFSKIKETDPVESKAWELYTDGACGPKGAGMHIAHQLGVKCLDAYIDSHLVANQVNGLFEVHDASMQSYLELVHKLADEFDIFRLTQVPRGQNKKADVFSKLAALTFDHLHKSVWVKVLAEKFVDEKLTVAPIEE